MKVKQDIGVLIVVVITAKNVQKKKMEDDKHNNLANSNLANFDG